MFEQTYCDEETIVKMPRSELEAMICKAKEEGYATAKKQERKAENIIKILEGLVEILKG